MSEPREIEFALVKMGDGATPENFVVLCGMQDVTINETANTTDRPVRNCDTPNKAPRRKVKVNSTQLDISSTGLTNIPQIALLSGALGKHKNYQIECYEDDGTDGGELVATYSGQFVMTSNNKNLTRESAASAEINLASHGDWEVVEA